MPTDLIDIARKSYQAYVEKDRKAIESLIAENFRFTSPLDNQIDRDIYFERCWANSANIADFKFIHMVQKGDQVFVTYESEGRDQRRFRNTEILTIQGQKIVEVEVYFGWNIPHEAPFGGFIDPRSDDDD